jgi:hypothetical protein
MVICQLLARMDNKPIPKHGTNRTAYGHSKLVYLCVGPIFCALKNRNKETPFFFVKSFFFKVAQMVPYGPVTSGLCYKKLRV